MHRHEMHKHRIFPTRCVAAKRQHRSLRNSYEFGFVHAVWGWLTSEHNEHVSKAADAKLDRCIHVVRKCAYNRMPLPVPPVLFRLTNILSGAHNVNMNVLCAKVQNKRCTSPDARSRYDTFTIVSFSPSLSPPLSLLAVRSHPGRFLHFAFHMRSDIVRTFVFSSLRVLLVAVPSAFVCFTHVMLALRIWSNDATGCAK